MKLLDALVPQRRDKYVPRLRASTSDSWQVAYGKISQLPEDYSWKDDHFAVIHGSWESCQSGRFIVSGQAHLTNRFELSDRHGYRTDESVSTTQDLSLVALLWSQHQCRTPELLTGAFAFSVWDRDEKTLCLVRDRVGNETVYYTTEGEVCYAGRRTDLTSKASREVDLVALRDYLCCAFVPGAQTMILGLREVRPGTIERFPERATTVYWRLEERSTAQNLPIENYSSRLRTILERAVQECLPASESVGVYLSGGLDSSCVAALAARLHGRPVHSYSIHFGNDCPNELEFSTLVAEHCRTNHHIVEITPNAMWSLLPQTMAQLDDPIGDPLTVPNLILGTTAKETVNTILNGEGGDPCFGGPKNQPMLLTQLYRTSSAPTRAPGNEEEMTASYLASFQKCAGDLHFLLKPEVWEHVRTQPSVFTEALNSDGSYLNKLMFINTRFKGADHILTKVGNLTRALGLRGCSPLFDDRLVDFSLEIPPEYKLDGACEKAVLKLAVADLLPSRILERPKSGMMVPVQRWFREHWSREAGTLLLSRNARTRRFLNQTVVRNWLNYRGDTWARYGVKLWLLVSLELWLQTNTSD